MRVLNREPINGHRIFIMGYIIGMIILAGGFALFCLALRWLLTKMGTPGTGKTEELSTLDPTYGLMNCGRGDINAMGADSSRYDPDTK